VSDLLHEGVDKMSTNTAQTELSTNFSVPRSSTILVMHPDALVCAGVVAALRQHSHFDVVVESPGNNLMSASDIDVVVTDFSLAVELACAKAMRAGRPLNKARILVLTASDREADIRRAISAGVHGYLLLGCPLSELVDGVATLVSGARYLSQAVAQRMAESLTHPELTSRELGVLQLVAMGDTNKAIARRLQIELGTVKSHMSTIMAKLGAASRTQAAGIAVARGLLDASSPTASKLTAPPTSTRAQTIPPPPGRRITEVLVDAASARTP
jgi:DNA-binding NarL/FixJ family response regulator